MEHQKSDKGWGEGLKTRKLCKRNCPNKIPEKEKPKEKRSFPQDGSHFDIKSVLNIISASGIKKKLMNTFYMLQEKFQFSVYIFS